MDRKYPASSSTITWIFRRNDRGEGGMEQSNLTIVMTVEEMLHFMKLLRDDVVVNVSFEENGGDEDDDGEAV